jgi:hypothetical protein
MSWIRDISRGFVFLTMCASVVGAARATDPVMTAVGLGYAGLGLALLTWPRWSRRRGDRPGRKSQVDAG